MTLINILLTHFQTRSSHVQQMKEFLIRIFTGKINSTSLDDCDINAVDDYYNYDYEYEEVTVTSTRPPIESRTEVVSTTGNSIIFSEFLLSSVGLLWNYNFNPSLSCLVTTFYCNFQINCLCPYIPKIYVFLVRAQQYSFLQTFINP